MTNMDGYSVTGYSAGDFYAPGKTLTVLESEVTSHPDHTADIGADRIKKGDPVLIGSIPGVSNITTAAATDQLTVETEGIHVFPVVCNEGTALVNGGPVYIHATAGTLHSTQGAGMKLFGTALGASTAASATMAVRVGDPCGIAPVLPKTVAIPIAGGAQNAFAFAWQNPEATKILILNAVARISAVSVSAGAVLDVGPVANATSTSDTLFDGLDIVTAVGNFSAAVSGGTNGLGCAVLDENGGTNDFLTGKILTAAGAALAGTLVVQYIPVA